jgi:hypothetical protein
MLRRGTDKFLFHFGKDVRRKLKPGSSWDD